jgi:uncharacterized protein (TIGR04255 family)
MLIPELLGPQKVFGEAAQQLITAVSAKASPGTFVGRWGKLPRGMTIDPSLLPPSEEDSWIIDLDVSETEEMSFDVELLITKVRSYAERIYTIFRWMVTDEFIREYGGTA